MKKVLVVDDEKSIVKGIKFSLEQDDMQVDVAYDGEEALTKIEENKFDLILTDIMMPKMDGFDLADSIRITDKITPIIFMTAKDDKPSKMFGYSIGIDDYVTKPFSPAELTARIDALYRRVGGDEEEESGEIVRGIFKLNTRNRSLEKNGERIRLTQVEYSIVKLFMDNPGKALSREEILNAVWGRDYEGELKIVDVNIRRLRIKIEDDTANPTYITTVWGFGYKWGA